MSPGTAPRSGTGRTSSGRTRDLLARGKGAIRAPLALLAVLAAAGAALVVTGLGATPTPRVASASPARSAAPSSAPAATQLEERDPRPDAAAGEAQLVAPDEAPGGSRRQEAVKPGQRMLAQGIVTDETGSAVPNACVKVELPRPHGGDDPVRWQAEPALQCTTGRDGRFRLEGRVETDRVALTALHPRYSSAPRTECEVGEKGIVLRLRAAGSIAGRLEIEPTLSVGLFTVSANGLEPESGHYAGMLSGDGAFEVSGLPSGSYEVVLALEHEPRTAVTLSDVLVSAGSITRLAPIDLRGRITAFRLRLRDAGGEPPPSSFVRRSAPGAAEFDPLLQPVRGGEVVIATLEPCIDLRIESPGHRSEVLECVSTDREVVLQPAPKVHIVLDEGLPSRRPELKLGVSLERHGPASGAFGRVCSFDEWGRAEADVEEPGQYDVRVYAWRCASSGVAALLSSQVETRIDVPVDLLEPVFVVRLSPETLARIDGDEGAAN